MNLVFESLADLAHIPFEAAGLVSLAGAGAWCLWHLLLALDIIGPKVTSRPLMTLMERRTIHYIEQIVPGVRVHAQVSMGALLEPRRSLLGAERRRLFFSFAAKRVDFVLEDRRTGKILALVELDDATHDAAADRLRDRLTATAGYLTIRLPAHERPTPQNVAARVQAALVREAQSGVSDFG